MSEYKQDCPKCGNDCSRDYADVGVGIIYGPWGCGNCGWSEDEWYDRSLGPAPADSEHPGWISDQWGNLHNRERLAEDLEAAGQRFGLNLSDMADKLRKP